MWPIAGAILDEVDRLHPNVIDEIKQRIQAKPNAHLIATQNPNNPNHPIYTELDFYTKMKDVHYQHFTLDDNPALSSEAKDKIIGRYDPESIFYKRFVLGQRIVAENLIYNVRDWNVFDDLDVSKYIQYVIVADPGVNSSATVFLLCAVTEGWEELHVIKEYWHRNADVTGLSVKMPIDYANDYANFIKECIVFMGGRYPEKIYTDTDITFARELIQAFKRHEIANLKFQYAIKEEIEDRIKTDISLLWNKKLKFYSGCPYTINSFKTAEYEPKKAALGVFERYDDPAMGTRIDAIDTTEYAISHYINRIYRK